MKKALIGGMAAALMILVPAGGAQAEHHLFHRKASPALPEGLPKKWDKKIPIPPGAVVASVKPPSGIVQTVDFTAPGDLDTLINFYNTELPKAGFDLGPHVKAPARKAYNLNFSKASVQDMVSIFPDTKDPSRFNVRVVYEVPSRRRHLLRLLKRWHVWPRFWRSEKPPTEAAQASQAGAAAAAPAPSGGGPAEAAPPKK
jgi:hypothetical protein